MGCKCRKVLMICSVALLLIGCATTQKVKRNFDVQTKMSDPVSLKRTKDLYKTIYVQAKNTSNMSFSLSLRGYLKRKGYKVVDNLNQANYLLQVNVLQAGEAAPVSAEKVFLDGYGSSVPAITLDSRRDTEPAIGNLVTHLTNIVNTATNKPISVKEATYTAIVDLQISEKITKEEKLSQIEDIGLKQDASAVSKQITEFKKDCTRYQSRVMAVANNVNLTLSDAIDLLEVKLTDFIVEIF